ncbi:hypothetical protein C474_17989 [Halogeometricum pallidum JCM 14848]|uniref:PRC-barrel domain-containing protein n=1 Tax=Halogeometricum pallidum JCM 14848 TaxID=1227487 RepID=M0CXT2_HALPD|nr:hypothetical protein [Halogeometricum pallidum]ELZ27262.1 hypothetical protein C474_17989 [Halogeometricum pallidum JCM 14848]
MQHITNDIVGKRVVGPDGERIGKVAGVQDGKAMLKGDTGVSADMEDALSGEDDETLSLTADQVVEVTDDEVRVSLS